MSGEDDLNKKSVTISFPDDKNVNNDSANVPLTSGSGIKNMELYDVIIILIVCFVFECEKKI